MLTPATIEDAHGMLLTALQDPDPVLIFENALLYNMDGELRADAGPVEIAHASIRRPGRDISVITYGNSLWKALEAARGLAEKGIEVEVMDLRTLRPLDDRALVDSVSHASRFDRGRRLAQRRNFGGNKRTLDGAGVLRTGRSGSAPLWR